MIDLPAQALELGAKVTGLDGEVGTLSRIVTDPHTYRPLYLIVRQGGLLHRREIVVPVSNICRSCPESIELDLGEAALAEMPDYEIMIDQWETLPREALPDGPMRSGATARTLPYTASVYAGRAGTRYHNVPDTALELTRSTIVCDRASHEIGHVAGLKVDPATGQPVEIVLRQDLPLVAVFWAVPKDRVVGVAEAVVCE